MIELLNPFYPQFVPASNCLETSLSNIGALFHPTPVLLNIGRIENDLQGFRYYWDGITPSVATLVGEIDQERMGGGPGLWCQRPQRRGVVTPVL